CKVTQFVCCCIFNFVEMQILEHQKGSLSFVYYYNFNTNGIFYWLGTNKGANMWQNPALCEYIRAYSSLAEDSKHARCVIGHKFIRYVTESKKQSWFVIEFKGIKSISTHYSLKFRLFLFTTYTFDIQCWRNWKFESSDGIMDCSRFNIYCKAVYVVDAPSEEDGPKCAKCLFKYWQDIVDILPEDDVGAARRAFHVVVSQHIGQELSGDTFAYSGDLDKQGLCCYWIGINFGTEELQNPVKCGLVVVRSNGWMNESVGVEAI
ncbi:hypothetical protein RFI_36864, partial [Reticulomyxa filosa]